jgi:hypothetical protein
VDLLDWFVQTVHKFEALGADPCQHQSPISAFARARDQTAFFVRVDYFRMPVIRPESKLSANPTVEC